MKSNIAITEFKKSELIWLSEGLKLISDTNIQYFSIDALSKSVGKARTSFYYLFKNLDNFFIQLTRYWAYKGTFSYIDMISEINDPKEKLILLMELINRDKIEGLAWIQLKQYGRNKTEVMTLIHEIEKVRINFVASLLENMGYTKENSYEKAESFMYMFFGWVVINWHNEKGQALTKNTISQLFKRLDIKSQPKQN